MYDTDDNLLASTVLTEATTAGDLLTFINNNGATATLQNGVFTITGGYIVNDALEESMGLTKSEANSYVLGSVVTVTTSAAATGSSSLGDIISALGTTSAVSGGYNLQYNGSTVAVGSGTTLDQLIGNINSVAGSNVASLEGGKLKVTSGNLTGTVADALGFVAGGSSVSATGNQLTVTNVAATGSTTFAELGIGDSSYVVKSSDGTALGTVDVTSTSTLDQFFAGLSAYTITGSITDGVISLSAVAKNYIVGDLNVTIKKHK